MPKLSLVISCIVLTFTILLTSCTKTSDTTPQPYLKIGLVAGLGGLSDAGFNQSILKGLQVAAMNFPIFCLAYECKTSADFATGIQYYLTNSFDLIITCGFDAAEATIAAANANPATDFVIIDHTMTSPPSNVLCAAFDVDQASFPCGFLAAWWANTQNNFNPVAGFVAGPEIPSIRQFSVSYTNGIAYFNNKYKKNVVSLGYYANSFADTLQGAKLADSLLQQNTSIVFVFAGKTGIGALYRMKESAKCAIGVDVDQFFSVPKVGPVLLTSCVKELDFIVYGIIYKYYNLDFAGGTIIHCNLSNKGVGMASFHYFDALVPDSIKTALTGIYTGITNGTIKTGWPE